MSIFNKYGVGVGVCGLFSSYFEVAARFQGDVLISAFNFIVQRPSDWDEQWWRKKSTKSRRCRSGVKRAPSIKDLKKTGSSSGLNLP